MKKGLTFISERTNQLRYANNAETEEWVQQLSTYIPIQEIKRGQPVSIATVDDLKEIAGDDEDLYNALLNSSDSYIVLTNPSKHESAIGLALEYTKGTVIYEDGTLTVCDKIHIIGQGQYIEDREYYWNAFTLSNNTEAPSEEYWPSFFDDYKSCIGKKIYVKGSTDGELTLVPEEAYLAHNNVIVIGIVADADIKDGSNSYHVGAIEVQIEGDDRGIIDATTFEAVVGEDVYIGKNIVQSNGEANSYTKVFALGSEDDFSFKFSLDFNASVNTLMPKGFIAIQRWDGKTGFIFTNGEITQDALLTNEAYSVEDRAFVQVSKYYAANSDAEGDKVQYQDLACTYVNSLQIASLISALKTAMAFVAPGQNTSLKTGVTSSITTLIVSEKGNNRYEFTADAVGGYFDVYISSNLTAYLSALNVACPGSYYNKGYAVLADIRNPARQNLIGIYNSGHTGLIQKGENAIFIKQGLFTDDSSPYETGVRYYLGSHGNIFKVPQEYYNSIISIGYAQAENKLIVDCCDSRQYNNGDLPVGYMKPSVKGNAEFGFWLMDGETPHKYSAAPLLYERLKNWYDESELQYTTYNFGTSDEPDEALGFIIPKVVYQNHVDDSDENESYFAQIKYLAEGVYKELPRFPFVRRYLEFEGDDSFTSLPDVDITSLMIYGPEEDRLQVPDLEQLDIKLFVNISDDTQNDERNWAQIEPGFHQTDNFNYYGFKWTVTQTEAPTINHPYGVWILRAAYTGTATADQTKDDENVRGICYLADPFASPIPLAGRKAKVFVTKRDYYSRQFDVEALFKDVVKESVVDASDTPWTSSAISGQAVRNDILTRVLTKCLVLGQNITTTLNGDGSYDDDSEDGRTFSSIEGYISTIKLIGATTEDEDDLANRSIRMDLRLAHSRNTGTYPFLDYYGGVLKYYYENETDDAKIGNKANLKNLIYKNDYALLPQYIFRAHENTYIDGATYDSSGSVIGVHGIVNTGYSGNLNAKTLQSANLGFPQHILAGNASESSSSYNEEQNLAVKITIPYTEKTSQTNDYLTRLGNHNRFYDNSNIILDEQYDISSGVSKKTFIAPAGNSVIDTIFSGAGSSKSIKVEYDLNNDSIADIKFTTVDSSTNDSSAATLYGNFDVTSSIKTKYAYHLFETSATPNAGAAVDNYEDKFDFEEDNLNEALQAIYEMPLATYRYNREHLNNDSNYYKKYFGVIVEKIAATKENVANNELSNKTTLDDLAYTYTEDERNSIAEYLNMVTDNNEEGMRVASVVGLLLKAAKETQERLLNLEVSTYGKDSPTLPGNDTLNSNLQANDQKSTIAGLNRLVKALCREVFQDADPTNIDEIGAWTEDSDRYSRLDMLDKEVNGEDAKDDTQNRIALDESKGEWYQDDNTETEIYSEFEAVVNDTKDNNYDFGSTADTSFNDSSIGTKLAVTYPSYSFTYTPNPGDEFDGLNDAVNRIVLKLDHLTKDVHGSVDIQTRPRKFDYIRGTLETVLKELYSVGDHTALEEGTFEKPHLSRIDRLLQNLYNYDLSLGETKGKNREFNGKTIYGIHNDPNAADYPVYYESVSSRSPEEISDIYGEYASIIDVIIELLAGSEENLVKTSDGRSWADASTTAEGWKTKNSVVNVSYSEEEYYNTNKLYRESLTILDRLDDAEKALQLIYSRFANSVEYTEDPYRNARGGYEGAYSKVTSIDDVMRLWSANYGLTHDSLGIYSNNRDATTTTKTVTSLEDVSNYDYYTVTEESESSGESSAAVKTYTVECTDWLRNDIAKAVVAEDWRNPLHGTVNNFDAYDIIYDLITRLKNTEWNLAYNNAKLGVDYDDYVDTNKNKTTYEGLEKESPEYNEFGYTVTSDLQAVLKLLYGADVGTTTSNNKTAYAHFQVANENNDNFTKSPATNGVSVLDSLYDMLFNIPQAYSATTTSTDNGTVTTLTKLTGTVDSIYSAAKYYDPTVLKAHTAASNSLLGFNNRKNFIESDGSTGSRRNRIDILEDWSQALYKFIGMGSNADENYFKGILGVTFGDSSESSSLTHSYSGKKVKVNSLETCSSVYSTAISKTESGNYTLSQVALQGYFNTLDIVALIGSGTTTGWTYSAPQTLTFTHGSNTSTISSQLASVSNYTATTYTIKGALDRLYSFIKALDSTIMNIKKVDSEDTSDIADIFTYLGSDYPNITGSGAAASGADDITTRFSGLEKRMSSAENDIGIEKTARSDLDTAVAACLGTGYISSGKVALQAGYSTIGGRLDTAEDSIGELKATTDTNALSEAATGLSDNDDEIHNKEVTQADDASDKLVKGSSVKEDLANLLTQVRTEYKQMAKDEGERALLYAYLKCESITCNGSLVKITRTSNSETRLATEIFSPVVTTDEETAASNKTGATETDTADETGATETDTADETGATDGWITIDTAAIRRAGDSVYRITLYDKVDGVTYSAYVPSGDIDGDGTAYQHITLTQYTVNL